MSDLEILQTAIRKAAANGWQGVRDGNFMSKPFYSPEVKELLSWDWDSDSRIFSHDEWEDYEEVRIEAILFDHDFARALWGEGEHYFERLEDDIIFKQSQWSADDGLMFNGSLWQYHLQQMVIADDPIKYLGENI